MADRACAGCAATLPPPKRAGGRQQKWCSERCRKAQYAGVCVDCGAPTNGSNGRGERAAKRCKSCASIVAGERVAQHVRAQAEPRRQVIARMWREGATAKQIAEAIGSTPESVSVTVVRMRAAGVDLPYHTRTPLATLRRRSDSHRKLTDEQIAYIQASPLSLSVLARELGVSTSAISAIRNGLTQPSRSLLEPAGTRIVRGDELPALREQQDGGAA